MIVYSYHPKRNDFLSWDLTISYEPIDDNRRYKVYNYKKVAVFNDLPSKLQENIRCFKHRRSFEEKEVEYIAKDVFQFGKYANMKITEVKDLKYTSWYYTVVKDEESKKFIHDYLYDNWYDFRKNSNDEEYVITPKRVKYEEEVEKKTKSFINNLNPNKKYYLEPTRNPNSEGKIKINDITYIFPKVECYWYNDICYYLPVCNGKSKRIKNKILECSLMNLDNEIYISSFKVVKY